MAKVPYIGVNGVARKCKSLYIGVDGVARKVKSGYIGVNGVAKQFFSSGKPLSEFAEGDIVYINENGSPVEFYVAKHDYESVLNGAGRTLVVRKECYSTGRGWSNSDINSYLSSTIHKWCNNIYKSLLDEGIQDAIGTTRIYYTVGNGSSNVEELDASIFILSLTELGKSVDYANIEGSALPIASELQIAYRENSAVTQWTRSPKTNSTTSVYYLKANGDVSNTVPNVSTYGDRPAFTLPEDTPVNESTLVVLG